MSTKNTLLAVIASLAITTTFAQVPTPSGWRYLVPTDSPIDAERVTLPMVKAEADFNGDGKNDIARILIRRAEQNGAGVFVFLANTEQPPIAKMLEEYKFSDGEFMLSTVKMGCYSSPERKVCLSNSGLVRSEIEHGWSTLYWLDGGEWKLMKFSRGEFNGL